MSNRFTTLSAAAALALAAIATPSSAAEYGKGVGAMTFETRGVATNPTAVGRQGGFATAGAVQWIATPAEQQARAVYGAGSVGALRLETLGLATTPADVRRQGGATTAGAVRWASAPAK